MTERRSKNKKGKWRGEKGKKEKEDEGGMKLIQSTQVMSKV
jgi:hypothetical protein